MFGVALGEITYVSNFYTTNEFYHLFCNPERPYIKSILVKFDCY